MRNITEVMLILKKIRKKKSISVQQVAKYIEQEINMQISKKTIYGWEEGIAKPDMLCFIAMCNLYQIQDIRELFMSGEVMNEIDITIRDNLYKAYVTRPDVQEAVQILLGINGSR